MKKSVGKKLKLWASSKNWGSSHPSDDEKFWDFVIEAFGNKDYDISEEDFYSQIIPFCSDEDLLTDSYIKYQDGIEVLRKFKKEDI